MSLGCRSSEFVGTFVQTDKRCGQQPPSFMDESVCKTGSLFGFGATVNDVAIMQKHRCEALHENDVAELLSLNLYTSFKDEWALRQLRWALEPIVHVAAAELVFERNEINREIHVFKRGATRPELPLRVLRENDARQPRSLSSSSDDFSLLSSDSD
jgi:hypothetical protein